MNYYKLLVDGYKAVRSFDQCCDTQFEYLSDYIFDFTTYDGEMSKLFCEKAIEVIDAITNRKTFDYIKDPENYKWYLLMCNMPFFSERLEWGSSIRGAWWDFSISFSSCGLFLGEDQLTEDLKFTQDEWETFMRSILSFANPSGLPSAGGDRPTTEKGK